MWVGRTVGPAEPTEGTHKLAARAGLQFTDCQPGRKSRAGGRLHPGGAAGEGCEKQTPGGGPQAPRPASLALFPFHGEGKAGIGKGNPGRPTAAATEAGHRARGHRPPPANQSAGGRARSTRTPAPRHPPQPEPRAGIVPFFQKKGRPAKGGPTTAGWAARGPPRPPEGGKPGGPPPTPPRNESPPGAPRRDSTGAPRPRPQPHERPHRSQIGRGPGTGSRAATSPGESQDGRGVTAVGAGGGSLPPAHYRVRTGSHPGLR